MWIRSKLWKGKEKEAADEPPSSSRSGSVCIDGDGDEQRTESKDEEGEEVHYTSSKSHHVGRGLFANPWPSSKPRPSTTWVPTLQIPLSWAEELHPSIRRIKKVEPAFQRTASANQIKATWLGHAGVLVQLPALHPDVRTINLVVDPIFSTRSSPSQWAGPARRLPPPCAVEELPHIDIVLISHNHYDHLDFYTMDALIKRGGVHTHYVVPLGLKGWLQGCKVPDEQIVELDWWDGIDLNPSDIHRQDFATSDDWGRIRINCVPAQHSSARTGLDKCSSLWAGYVVEQYACASTSPAPERTAVYFAGDTGYKAEPGGAYCPAFEQIGEQFGPIDFSAVPIWRGGTLSFVASLGVRLSHEALTLATHATPEDAVCIHSDVKSKATMAIHYGTFAGSEDEATYPIALLEEACIDVYIPFDVTQENGFGVCDVGETLLVPVRRKV